MTTMITLRLAKDKARMEYVKGLAGLEGLAVDEAFGLILCNKKTNLYVMRVRDVLPDGDVDRRRLLSPEIVGVYGDTRIST